MRHSACHGIRLLCDYACILVFAALYLCFFPFGLLNLSRAGLLAMSAGRLIDSRGVGSSYSGGVRNGATSGRGDGGDDLDSDYVIVHPSAGLGTAAPGRQQPPSPGRQAPALEQSFSAQTPNLALLISGPCFRGKHMFVSKLSRTVDPHSQA